MPDIDLTRIAQRRSCDMARGMSDFSHTDAQGNFIAGDMVRGSFGPYGSVGENIMEMGGTFTRVFGPEEFARAAVEGWMKSPGHRENILNPRYDTCGIGVAMAGDMAFATQVFRGPPRVLTNNTALSGAGLGILPHRSCAKCRKNGPRRQLPCLRRKPLANRLPVPWNPRNHPFFSTRTAWRRAQRFSRR